VLVYVLYTLFVISCFILILVVLLQPGKGDVASALGGGVSGAAFGPRGATTLLAKITIGAAVAFMGIAFALSVPGLVTNRSVTSGIETPADEPAPAPAVDPATAPAVDPAAQPAPEGAVPAGQITIGNDNTMKTDAPAKPGEQPAPAPAPAPAPTKK
jgi:preprotein translocase subunit SecG